MKDVSRGSRDGESSEYDKKPFELLTSDDPVSESGMEAWQEEDIGRPIHGRTKKAHDAAKKVYDLFPSEEVGGHFTRSGSPGNNEDESVQ